MKIVITQPGLVRVASIFQSNDATRYSLNGIYFCEAKRGGVYIVSTDGHRLSVGYDAEGKIDGDVIIQFPRDFLKHLTPKRESIVLQIDDPLASVVMLGDDGKPLGPSTIVCSPTVIDETYPDWRRVVPITEGIKTCHTGFNPKYMADYKAVLTALGIKDERVMIIVGEHASSAHRIHISGVDNWFGVLSHMRFGNKMDVPEWFDGAPQESE